MIAKQPTILFAEDEVALAEIIKENLEARGLAVIHFGNGTKLLEQFYSCRPDMVVLDVMLPDTDGFAISRQIRETDQDTPILFLTSKSLPQDVVAGFESGGNDYLKKPFSIEELAVRIKALLARNPVLFDKKPHEQMLSIGQYQFDHNQHKLFFKKEIFPLTSRECAILKLLVLNKNQIVERKTILLHVWQSDDFFAGRSLDVFITKLRKVLHNDPLVQISNARGVGYKLIC